MFGFRHKPQAETGTPAAPTTTVKERPILRPSVHEIVIRNQLMAVEPPLELARVNWVSFLFLSFLSPFLLSFMRAIFDKVDISIARMVGNCV